MAGVRRNSISHDDAVTAGRIAALSAVVAVFSAASPTGATPIDVVLVAALAAFVTWAGATAPWWALTAGAGIALFGSLQGPVLLTVLAAAAMLTAAWIGLEFANRPALRTLVAAAVVQVGLRLEWDGRFLVSALIAGTAMAVVVITGYRRRKRYVRQRVLIGAAGLAGVVALAGAGIAVGALQARDDARAGYIGLLDGLEFIQNGDVAGARATLEQAASDLDDAGDRLGGPLTQPARLLPGVAQNRNGGVDVLRRAAAAAESAAATLAFVDLDQLTVDNGFVDVDALAVLEQPLTELERTVSELRDALHDARSPWMITPLQSRLNDGIRRADQAAHQAEATAAAARIGPTLLGADGTRTYFLAFVNAAEARGLAGLMGSWSELTVSDGRLRVTANGRTADLQQPELSTMDFEASDEFLDRYRKFGAQVSTGGVAQKYWANVTASPDMPSVGSAMAQMYEAATGTEVDGVFVIDGAGLAALLGVTGPVELTDIGRRIDGGNAEQFLSLGQYEFAENEREDLLATVTEQTVDNVLETRLPPPQQIAPALAPAVLNGHISGWAVRPEEQELFELVGMDAALPVVSSAGVDALAVVSHNASGNKIENFLQRRVEYTAVVEERSGAVSATLRIELTNTAPTTGYPDYVIGNIIDLPVGTNRMLLEVFTRLDIASGRRNGEELRVTVQPDLGYNVMTMQVDIAPDETAVIELDLTGRLGGGEYRLLYRPQPLPNPDAVVIDATTTGGSRIISFDGELERRSVLDRAGVNAWR